MAKKPARSVWEPTRYTTTLGGVDYVLEPQPISKVLEFDALLEEVGGAFEGEGEGYIVYDLDQETAYDEVYETASEAEDWIKSTEAEELEVRPAPITPQALLAKVIETPFLILKPMIPDLKAEDVANSPVGEIEHCIGLLVEVNGMKWFESMVKNFLEPLVPILIENTAAALSTVLPSSTDRKET
jgi:hypothetical protein